MLLLNSMNIPNNGDFTTHPPPRGTIYTKYSDKIRQVPPIVGFCLIVNIRLWRSRYGRTGGQNDAETHTLFKAMI